MRKVSPRARGEPRGEPRGARLSARAPVARSGSSEGVCHRWLSLHFRRFARRTLPWSKIEVFPVRSIILDIFEAMLAVVRAVSNGT